MKLYLAAGLLALSAAIVVSGCRHGDSHAPKAEQAEAPGDVPASGQVAGASAESSDAGSGSGDMNAQAASLANAMKEMDAASGAGAGSGTASGSAAGSGSGAGSGAASGSAAGAPGHVWHMKKVELKTGIGWDPMPQWGIQGKQQETIVAMSMLVPVDWNFAGGPVATGPMDCNMTAGRLGFRAVSPDGKMGVVSLAAKDSVWSSDRGVLQAIQGNNQQFSKMQFCKIEQPQPLAAKIAGLAQAAGKGIQVTGQMEPIPGVNEKLGRMVAQANEGLARQAAQTGARPAHIAVEAGRIATHGTTNGQPSDGYFAVMQVTRTDTLQNGATFLTTDYPMEVGVFAPEGKLAAQDAMFSAMLDSVEVSPRYEEACAEESGNMQRIQTITKQRLNQIYANMAADNANAARQQQAIRQGVQNYAAQVHSSVAAHRSAALENSSQQFALHMGDQGIYKDPSTGQNVQLSNQYSHAWASTTGNTNEYILTDSPSFNPNGQVGSGSWTQMQAVQ